MRELMSFMLNSVLLGGIAALVGVFLYRKRLVACGILFTIVLSMPVIGKLLLLPLATGGVKLDELRNMNIALVLVPTGAT